MTVKPELSAAEKYAHALQHGYDSTKVPAEGMAKILMQHCRAQTNRECGCGVDKCQLSTSQS